MKLTSSLSSKGQVTIPNEIRTRLGLKTGDRVEFVVEGSRTILRPDRGEENPFDAYIGALGTFPGGKKEIQAWLDELRGNDPER